MTVAGRLLHSSVEKTPSENVNQCLDDYLISRSLVEQTCPKPYTPYSYSFIPKHYRARIYMSPFRGREASCGCTSDNQRCICGRFTQKHSAHTCNGSPGRSGARNYNAVFGKTPQTARDAQLCVMGREHAPLNAGRSLANGLENLPSLFRDFRSCVPPRSPWYCSAQSANLWYIDNASA